MNNTLETLNGINNEMTAAIESMDRDKIVGLMEKARDIYNRLHFWNFKKTEVALGIIYRGNLALNPPSDGERDESGRGFGENYTGPR